MFIRVSKSIFIISAVLFCESISRASDRDKAQLQQHTKQQQTANDRKAAINKKLKEKQTEEAINTVKKCNDKKEKSKCFVESLKGKNKDAAAIIGFLGNFGNSKK